MRIIGLGHYSRTGKDSFANYLVEKLQRTRLKVGKIPWAWKLKDVCHQLYGWAGLREATFYETPEGAKLRDVVLPAIGKTPVQIWVDMGTPAVRDQVYDRTWIDYVLQTDHGLDVLLIPDVRFENEIEAIRALGGQCIKVVRPGYGPKPTVADRTLVGYRNWDNVIGDEGSMASLEEWADRYFREILDDYTLITSRPQHEIDDALAVEKIEPWTPPAHYIVPSWQQDHPMNLCSNVRLAA